MTISASKNIETPIVLNEIVDIIDDYDAFIIDLWGVLHNGIQPYPGVIEFLKHLKSLDKNIVFLSNAPRRSHVVIARMLEMGFTVDLFDQVLTSGEATYLSLKNRADDWHKQLGQKMYHIGPERDLSVFEDLDYELVSNIDHADFILNTGTNSFSMTLKDYIPELDRGLANKLPMICANPDQVVVVGDDMPACAGALAQYYAQYGGEVMYHGKPFLPIYQMALRMLKEKSPDLLHSDVLCIGDAFETDIIGGQSMEFDTLWIVETGIHGKEVQLPIHDLSFQDRCLHICQKYDVYPTYIFPNLSLGKNKNMPDK